MIYVECKTETALVKSLVRVPRREIIHEIKGKAGVCEKLEKHEDCKGLVDEDPQSAQPPYIRKLTLEDDFPQGELKVLCDESKGNRLIVLCPKFEDWILKAAREAKVDVRKYGLPDDPDELHKVINLNLVKLEKLLEGLKDSDRIKALRKLLLSQ